MLILLLPWRPATAMLVLLLILIACYLACLQVVRVPEANLPKGCRVSHIELYELSEPHGDPG